MSDAFADFPKQLVTRQRQFAALLRWSKPKVDEGLPGTKPAETWVQQRIVAERIPLHTDNYVALTMSYTLMYYGVAQNVRPHMNAYNDEATETGLNTQVDAALIEQMPKFCAQDASQAQVDQWYADHGFPV